MREVKRQKSLAIEEGMACRIKDVPDDIIRHIGTFLSAAKASRFSSTCKKFKNHFSIIQELEFVEEAENLTGFLNRVLALPVTETRIRKFSLKCLNGYDPAHINRCLRHVVKLGVMDIKLCMNRQNGHSLPLELFNCNTVVNLELGDGFVISRIPGNASLGALETLRLNSIRFYALGDCVFEALLSASPLLKKLGIYGMSWETWNWAGNVSSQSLERLTICRDMSANFTGPGFQNITFDAPKLAYLEYFDVVPDAYTIVNFDSLVEAELDLQVLVDRRFHGGYPLDGDILSSNPTNLIRGLRNVKILDLSSPLSFDTFYYFREAMPVFGNLHTLKLRHDEEMGFCLRILPVLLNRTPHLKTLIMTGGLHFVEGDNYVCQCLAGYSCLLSCPVEVLDIQLWNNGTPAELKQLEHFLAKLSCLKLLLLRVRIEERIRVREELRIGTELRILPRASTECEIQITNW